MDISVERYTFKGNPLTLDFEYVGRLDEKYRMFQATSVVANTDRALLLAFNYPGIRDGILNSHHHESEMISVVEDSRFWQGDTAQTTIDWMRKSGIIVRPITDMPTLAAQARRDLLL